MQISPYVKFVTIFEIKFQQFKLIKLKLIYAKAQPTDKARSCVRLKHF